MATTMQLRLDGSTLWLDGKPPRPLTDEDRDYLAELAARTSAWNRSRGDAYLAAIGRDLHTWLGAWATPLRAPHLTLDVVGDDAVFRETPWELLHDGQGFLVDGGFEVIRRLVPADRRGTPKHGLTLVFMAASPRTHRPGLGRLRFEEEEAAILRAVGERKLLLSVEETGSAQGLGERLSDLADDAPAPVVHITGHGTSSPPILLLEDDQGGEAPTSAADLLDRAGFRLTEASLVVVSACETAAASSVGSFATALVQGGVRAALGWSASVSDAQATLFASKLYERLCEGDPVDRALNTARRHLKNQKDHPGTDWHLARLVAGPTGGGPVARKNGLLPALGTGSRAFGGNRKVQIATRLQFVGRRPHLQAALRALASDELAGVLLTGLGHQGKSSLAGRLADRHRGPIAVCCGAEELTAPAVLLRVQEALGQAGTSQAEADRAALARNEGGLQGMLHRLLANEPQPLLLVLDDVEQVLVTTATPVRVADKYEGTLRAVLAAFEQLTANGRTHRLILTSRVAFHLPSFRGEDLMTRTLREVRLEGMPAVERALLPAAREAAELPADVRASCLDASAGNPGLAALLLRLARDLQATGELERLPSILAGSPGASPQQAELDAWMDEVVGVLVDQRLSDTQRDLLRLSAVLPGPVQRAAVVAVLGEATGATERDAARLEALALWESLEPGVDAPPEVQPTPLALQRVPPLDAATKKDLARSLLTALRALAVPPPGDFTHALTRVHLGLTAQVGEGLAEPAELVLAALLAVHELRQARDLGRQVIALLRGEDRPIPDGIRWRVADAVEYDAPEEALDLLDVVSDESLVLLRRGRLLQRRGDLSEAERCFRRFGEQATAPRDVALAQGHIADILEARGQLDDALRIRKEEQLPVYDRLGDIRSRAVTMGKIADILQARGQLDDALRIRKEEELPVYDRLGDVRSRAVTMGKIADILQARGQLDDALRIRKEEELPVYDRLGDVRSRAVTMGQIADILQARGQLDDALRIRKEEQLPVYDRLGDVRERAVTMGKIADILQARGQLDDALRIRKEEELPVYDRLGDVRSRAVTMGQIADILQARGQLDDALRIRKEEELPVHDRLGDVRERAVTMGKIADILQARGQLDDALRIRKEEELPVYDRLGDVRSRAVTMGQIADILQARGQLDDALRIRKEEELPVYDRLGDVRSLLVARVNTALVLLQRQRREDIQEIIRHLLESLAAARSYGFPVEAHQIESICQKLGLPTTPTSQGGGEAI